ncbi:hypothetical protein [uncultured Duncaniella sp.]|uniref:hypothetical protein n=1 Tax=uncultured Duncaniella sp. TaxID=2768039 RepID=UPI002676D6BE|nr:hypothetical protein [uncultured Duncaniella sp.]
MPKAEHTTEEATPHSTEADSEAEPTQYEPTIDEAEAILTEEERSSEETVA